MPSSNSLLQSRGWFLAVVSAAGPLSFHFLAGVFLWIYETARGTFDIGYACDLAWPCFGLLTLSLGSLLLAIRRHWASIPLLLLTLLLAGLAFWYDVSHERWQWCVFLGTDGHLQSHPGRPEFYLIWWWY